MQKTCPPDKVCVDTPPMNLLIYCRMSNGGLRTLKPTIRFSCQAHTTALMWMLGWPKPVFVEQRVEVTMHEARRMMVWAMNTWDARVDRVVGEYTLVSYGGEKTVEVTRERLEAEFSEFRESILNGIKKGASSVVWS